MSSFMTRALYNYKEDMLWYTMQKQETCSLVCCVMKDGKKGRTEEIMAVEGLADGRIGQWRALCLSLSLSLSLSLKSKNAAGNFCVLRTPRLQLKEHWHHRKPPHFLQALRKDNWCRESKKSADFDGSALQRHILGCIEGYGAGLISVLFHVAWCMGKPFCVSAIIGKKILRIRAPDRL